MDANEFIRNQSALTLEELAPDFEQHVAWSPDGTRILAHATDEGDLFKEIDRLGLKSDEYVIGFVPDPEISDLGGALVSDILLEDVPIDDPGPVPMTQAATP